jgi:outer membrane receptor for ferric coprogen and ferric-rhodotorulic acid
MRSSTYLLFACTAVLSTPTCGQSQVASANDEENGTDQEILVTGRYTIDERIDSATGLGLSPRETPQSVSIVTAQRIRDQNLISVADIIQNAVGVAVSEVDDVRHNFYARGFEIRNTQLDGVPANWTLAGANGETNIDVSIYERVEIVRGATGLLSGAGDPSASVNLVRKHADAVEWTGYANAQYGSWDTFRGTLDLGGAVTSDGRVRVRAVGRYETGQSYIDLYDNEKFVLYGVIDADVTHSTQLRAGISHQEAQPDGALWGALPTFYTDGSTTDFPRWQSTAAEWTHWNTTNQNIFAAVTQDFGARWNLTLNYNRIRTANESELLYLYGNVDEATGTIEFSNPYKADGHSLQNSYDGQIKGLLNLFGRDHEVVLGALHSVLNRHTDNYEAPLPWAEDVPLVGRGGATFAEPVWGTDPERNEEERIEQTGYYGALRMNIADPLKVIVGGRLASWEQRGFAWSGPSDYGDDNVFIPYVGALYDITPGHRLYASYTEIFQPQNLRDRDLDLLDPLAGKAYEIGIKSAFFDEALQTSFAVFRIEQDNVGQPDIIVAPPNGGIPQQTYIAAEGVTSEGFEIEVTGRPLPGWNVNLGFSLFEAEDESGTPANTDQPRRLLKLFTTYDLPGTLDGLTIGGGVNYRSRAFTETIPCSPPLRTRCRSPSSRMATCW